MECCNHKLIYENPICSALNVLVFKKWLNEYFETSTDSEIEETQNHTVLDCDKDEVGTSIDNKGSNNNKLRECGCVVL